MFQNILIFILLSVAVFGESAVVMHDRDYEKINDKDISIIYSKNYKPLAKNLYDLQTTLIPLYNDTFGFKLDEKLYNVLASDYNQVANGFTTIYPYLRQVDYIGGSLMSDYFCSTSWINTLIYHESSHVYQLDAKNNLLSSSLHKVFKNGTVIIPWFSSPNIMESPFLMEGNAVLNESWHGEGGRLYGGNFKAETLLQAKYRLLTPELLYNDNLHFLYGSHFYTLGSYFQYFLAKEYGLDVTNSYWRVHARNWAWPFMTNFSVQNTFGKSFERLLREWNNTLYNDARAIREAKGKLLGSSQFEITLNADDKEIYTVINPNGVSYPKLFCYNKATNTATKTTTTLSLGKVVKTPKGVYATQTSGMSNPWRVVIGLYDKDRHLVAQSGSKVIEGYINSAPVYFDVTTSWHRPQLYVGNEYFGGVNSSVFVAKDAIYYIRQNAKTRTYYKNKTPLFTTKGFYGHIVGANTSGVYFIANTKLGSGLYMYNYKTEQFYLLNQSDTIVDARIVDDTKAVVVSVGHESYKILEVTLEAKKQEPYEVVLFMENKPYYAQVHKTNHKPLPKPKPYHSLLDIHYSGTDVNFGIDENAGLVFNLSLLFADPLVQNSLAVFLNRNVDEYLLGGITYTNEQYFINYMISAYGVLDKPNENARDYGLVALAGIDLLHYGYNSSSVQLSYYEDYTATSRKPLSLSFDYKHKKRFGYSMYNNLLFALKGYSSFDRGDTTYGAKGEFSHELLEEFFLSLKAQYSKSDATYGSERGVKIAKNIVEQYSQNDPSAILMRSLKYSSIYTKSANEAGVKITKVLPFEGYFFTFPLSLRRESLSLGLNYFNLKSFGNTNEKIWEAYTGIMFDTILLNTIPLPIEFRYLYNNNETIANKNTFVIQLGYAF